MNSHSIQASSVNPTVYFQETYIKLLVSIRIFIHRGVEMENSKFVTILITSIMLMTLMQITMDAGHMQLLTRELEISEPPMMMVQRSQMSLLWLQ